MGIARVSATGLAVAALVIGVAATGCSKDDKESSAESTPATSATSAEATTSEESATEDTSAPAEPVDYGSLLIPAADMGPDTKTSGPQVNPNGIEGALPLPPLTSIVPAIVTFPLAKIVTGVLRELRLKVMVTPAGMLTVVKLKTPLSGS